jgi:maleamate amidohydrolase
MKTIKNLPKNRLGLGVSPALVLVDMINGFTDPDCPLGTSCPSVVAANIQLLDAFRAFSLPIFFTTVVYRSEQQAQVFRQKVPALNVLTPDSHWVQIDPALGRKTSEMLIEKQWASGFFKTQLDDHLRSLKVDSLVVTGLTTSGCVRATVVDGLQNDYRVVVAEEAVGDRNPEAHRANLFDLNAKYADVQSVSEILAYLPTLAKLA